MAPFTSAGSNERGESREGERLLGNDTLSEESGTDKFYPGGGTDRIDGGNGAEGRFGDLFGDTVNYYEATKLSKSISQTAV